MLDSMADECEIPALHERYTLTANVDAHGNTRPGHLAAVEVLVWGWEPPSSAEPFVQQHDRRVVVDILLYAPASMDANPHDRVHLSGQVYEVIGVGRDPAANPWFQPDLVAYQLKRVQG